MSTHNALEYRRTMHRNPCLFTRQTARLATSFAVFASILLHGCSPQEEQKKAAKFVPYPVQVNGLTSGFIDVAIGGGAACALNEAGKVYCWGSANYLDPNKENRFTAQPIRLNVPNMAALMSGANLVMLRQTGESAFHITSGLLFEYPAPQTAFSKVSNDTDVDDTTSCIFLATGELRCQTYWLDYNTPITYGMLNVRQTVGLAVFQSGKPLDNGVSILEDGSVVCSAVQQCGNPSTRNQDIQEHYGAGPTLAGAPKATFVSNGCLVSEKGLVYCWGENGWGQLGTGSTAWFDGTWKPALHVAEATKVTTTYEYSCALTRKGQLWCWGANFAGQLGIGYVSSGNCPEEPPGRYPGPGDPGHYTCGFGVFEPQLTLENVKDFAISALNTCAVLNDGSVKCWGSQRWGALGNGVVLE